ncbi:MAG: serine hydrolase [Candidatus Glassbacteria bacterium]
MPAGKTANALLIAIALLTACSAGRPSKELSSAAYFPPAESMGGWRKNTDSAFVRSLGIDPQALEEFGSYNLSVPAGDWKPYSDYAGTIVIKDGWIVGEWYNVPEARDFMTYLSSNGKSVAIACFGIMAGDGRLGRIPFRIDENSRVYDPRWLAQGFPLSDPRKAEITFEMIFRHSSGICPERDSAGGEYEQGRNAWSDYTSWIVGRDPKWPVTGRLVFDPGHPEQWAGADRWGMVDAAYSSVGFGHVGLVITNVYGKPAHEYLRERLCEPMGYSGIDFHAPPSDSIRWFSAGGLRMTPRDYARFAWLLLNDGRWGDSQLVPSDWIRRFRSASCYPNILSNAEGVFVNKLPADMFRIAGSGLNWAFIVPSLDLVALRTGRVNNERWDQVQAGFLEKMAAFIQ